MSSQNLLQKDHSLYQRIEAAYWASASVFGLIILIIVVAHIVDPMKPIWLQNINGKTNYPFEESDIRYIYQEDLVGEGKEWNCLRIYAIENYDDFEYYARNNWINGDIPIEYQEVFDYGDELYTVNMFKIEHKLWFIPKGRQNYFCIYDLDEKKLYLRVISWLSGEIEISK